jgi:ketosteroid isomerase-like protein
VARGDDRVQLVLAYIEAAQHARATGKTADFDAVRRFLAPDVEVKMASPWTDEPWRVFFTSADAMLERLKAPINSASSLTTENVNVQRAGEDVMVEQLSIVTDQAGRRASMVCHIFSVHDGVITGIRAYRNDNGIRVG